MLLLQKKSLEMRYNLVFMIKILFRAKKTKFMNAKTVIQNFRQKTLEQHIPKYYIAYEMGNQLFPCGNS